MVVISYALNPASLSVNFELSAMSNICKPAIMEPLIKVHTSNSINSRPKLLV